MRVFIAPQYNVPDRGEGGIRRVVEALVRYLPDFGWEVVAEPRTADLTAGHGVLAPVERGRPFVSHCHGLHWSEYHWPAWAYDVNRQVIDALVQAQAVTAPSHWVAGALTRGMFVNPVVIHHGVDADEWAPAAGAHHGGYVLWNKARVDPVSNPEPMQRLAGLMPDVPFVTTFGRPGENVSVVGSMPQPQLKDLIQRAGVYLATARETFGIGTLEALASGVPVAGWRYGGQVEIVAEGETGYLAEPGDWAGLEHAVRRCLAERARLSANAVADARARWAWPDKIEQYAALYQQVLDDWQRPKPTVSVIVTSHNLGRYLADCLASVHRQPLTDWECVIVDDASSDETPAVAASFCERDARFHYVRSNENLKLVGALNLGAERASGRYLVNLDGDNLLPENALEACVDALDSNPALHIAYGMLDVVNEQGGERRRNGFPSQSPFDWRAQMAHLNQIHSSAMMRREVRERSGGYRARMWRAEDAEFWCRVTSFGFRAQRVTDTPTLIYRDRSDSKSKHEPGDGPWNEWFPWHGALSGQEGWQAIQQGQTIRSQGLVPFGAAGERIGKLCWDVHHQQQPLVSVIIPLGPGHERYVIDALDSLVAQDFGAWEAIVVNSTGHELTSIPGAPHARIVDAPAAQVGAARNAGVKAARGRLIYFLDADDYLRPGGLGQLVRQYATGESAYVYSDYLEIGTDWSELLKEQPEFQQTEWKMQHSINALLARVDFDKIGGFDEALPGWEDWDFFVKAAVKGFCGKRLAMPAWSYRKHTGHRRDESFALTDQLLPVLKERWSDYYNGVKPMGSCCPGNGDAVMAAKQAILAAEAAMRGDPALVGRPAPEQRFEQTSGLVDVVRMEFIGEQIGAKTFFGVDGASRQYRGGNNPFERFADVSPRDVAKLESTSEWRRVAEPEPEPEMQWFQAEPEPELEFAVAAVGLPAPAPRAAKLVPASGPLDGEPIGDVDQLLAEIPAPPLTAEEQAMAKALAAEKAEQAAKAPNGHAFEAAAQVPASMSADIPEPEAMPVLAKARGKAKKG